MISAVVPVFNEEPVLRNSFLSLSSFLESRFGSDFEIVAVDDGSRDRSLEILNELAPSMPLEIRENTINLGKGSSVRRGMLEARGEYVFFTDADLSTPLEELDRFLPRLEDGADVVIGTRKHAEAVIRAAQSGLRTFMGRGYTHVVNSVLGTGFSDYTCGFKAFQREAAQAIFTRSVVDGWSFDAEILFLAHRLGLRVDEVPVTWEDRPNSKVRLVRDTSRSFAELLAIRVRAARGRYGL
ncbi:MAG: dolichyl-phosphate beta-glucosyltransferase [Planctomycetota bacterium]